MYLISIKFIGSFPDGDKVVEINSPNGGGSSYHIMVDNYYWGTINYTSNGWRVWLTIHSDDYTIGDLQPLLELVNRQTII